MWRCSPEARANSRPRRSSCSRAPRVEGPPAIVAEGLTRKFGDFAAVDHVSFSIDRGEIFGFLGSNGCGKTTTMKMLTGLLGITEGRAELLGTSRRGERPDPHAGRLHVAIIFALRRADGPGKPRPSRPALPDSCGRDRGARRGCDQAIRSRAGCRQKADGLPLGIRQRLQLAAACLHRPEVLILDEPTSGVDPAARDMFWRLLGDLSRRDGVTIFVSTHFMNEAERCDRISLMHAGRVLAVGTPKEIRASESGGHAGGGLHRLSARSGSQQSCGTAEVATVRSVCAADDDWRAGREQWWLVDIACAHMGICSPRGGGGYARPRAPRICAWRAVDPDGDIRLRHFV